MAVFEGKLTAGPERYAVVVSRFNELVTQRLLEGARETFRQQGIPVERLDIAWVPGAFEIPLIAHRLAHSGLYAAVCCLGAVVQGETSHHEYINHQVAARIQQISLETGLPVLFGLLTCSNMQQALDRAGGKAGNKGSECALAAIEMVQLLRTLPAGSHP